MSFVSKVIARIRNNPPAYFALGMFVSVMAYAASNPASIPAVPTIAAMQALGAASSQYSAIYVTDYASSGDSGGGIFKFRVAACTPNTGTCFSTTVAPTICCWVRQYSQLNLDFFNTSTNDDSTAFNNAAAFAGLSGQALYYTSGKTYVMSHNIVSLPGVAMYAAAPSSAAGSNTIFNFTNDIDTGCYWTINGSGALGTYTPGNVIQGILLLGNGAGTKPIPAGAGICFSRVSHEVLRDIDIDYINGPAIKVGNTVLSTLDHVNVFGAGNSTTCEVEIDGGEGADVAFGGTTLWINDSYFGSDNGNGAIFGLCIDRYDIVNMTNGGVESAGGLLRVEGKPSTLIGAFNILFRGVDFESPNNGATSIGSWGGGWTGLAGRGVIASGYAGGSLTPNLVTTTSNVIVKESTDFFVRDTVNQTAANGITLFDFQGANNFHETLNNNDVGIITAVPFTYTYVKVNGSVINDALPYLPWSVDNEPVTIANLPACTGGVGIGRTLYVTNATQTVAANIGAVVAGTASNVIPVNCDGTNWRVGGGR